MLDARCVILYLIAEDDWFDDGNTLYSATRVRPILPDSLLQHGSYNNCQLHIVQRLLNTEARKLGSFKSAKQSKEEHNNLRFSLCSDGIFNKEIDH